MIKSIIIFLSVSSILAMSIQTVSKQTGERIVGGELANPGQFPFVAAIYKYTANSTYFCSGALILTQWIATAGQCVDGAVTFSIRLGSNSLSSNDPNAVIASTDTYFLHPDFDPLTLSNDIGVIKLLEYIESTSFIRSVNLMTTITLPDYASVLTLGWGETSNDGTGLVDGLNYVSLTALSNERCRQVFGNQINDNMVCADGNYNEGICRGDLGSPLIQNPDGSFLVELVGIGSFLSSNGCESTDPSGFTRISAYLLWILNVTSSDTNT